MHWLVADSPGLRSANSHKAASLGLRGTSRPLHVVLWANQRADAIANWGCVRIWGRTKLTVGLAILVGEGGWGNAASANRTCVPRRPRLSARIAHDEPQTAGNGASSRGAGRFTTVFFPPFASSFLRVESKNDGMRVRYTPMCCDRYAVMHASFLARGLLGAWA
ncbi:hypothetical protein GQ53DRAFT_759991 [Thozetella sp. PMI_491]|nr:hypothetical protein GQ53DRAFT_759991 [Thozetella sp. PMI_491]